MLAELRSGSSSGTARSAAWTAGTGSRS